MAKKKKKPSKSKQVRRIERAQYERKLFTKRRRKGAPAPEEEAPLIYVPLEDAL